MREQRKIGTVPKQLVVCLIFGGRFSVKLSVFHLTWILFFIFLSQANICCCPGSEAVDISPSFSVHQLVGRWPERGVLFGCRLLSFLLSLLDEAF